MAAFLERIGIFAGRADARAAGDIERDIDEELDFHLGACARELEREGLDAGQALAEARRRFGDVGAVRRTCARIRMGERIMLKWFLIASNVVLLVVVAALYASARRSRAVAKAQRAEAMASVERIQALMAERLAGAAREQARVPQVEATVSTWGTGDYQTRDGMPANLEAAAGSWSQAFDEDLTSWRHAVRVAGELSKLEGARSAEILARIWSQLPPVHREHVLEAFVVDGGHPMALEVLDLGVDDPVSSVRGRALLHLQTYAWRDLSVGDGAAEAWMVEWSNQPIAAVIAAHAGRWAKDLGWLLETTPYPSQARMGPLLEVVDHVRTETVARAGVDLGALLRSAGVCDRLTIEALAVCDVHMRERAQVVLGWCAGAPTPR